MQGGRPCPLPPLLGRGPLGQGSRRWRVLQGGSLCSPQPPSLLSPDEHALKQSAAPHRGEGVVAQCFNSRCCVKHAAAVSI